MLKTIRRVLFVISLTLFVSLALATSVYADGTIIVEASEPDIFPDGQCSLIEAIHNANDDAQTYTDCSAGNGSDTIILQREHVYTLTALDDTTSDLDGLPPINSTIIIEGNAATIKRSDIFGIDEFRIFHVGHPGNLTLKSLTISNGYLSSDIGGGIWNHYDSIVTLINVTIVNSTAGEGSGIYNSGTMVINTSVISGNNAADSIDGSSAGIMNDGVLTMTRSIVANNIAGQCGGIDNSNDVLFISNSTIDNNSSGLCNIGHAMIVRSTISNNHDGGDGGGINNSGFHSVLTVEDSTISNNTAGNGGGIQNEGTATVRNSTISNNIADFAGGGIDNQGAVNLTNVTITNNTANNDNDGGSEGGGGGISQRFGTVNMVNTVLAGNIDRKGHGPDCLGEITSIGHNLIQDTTGCVISGPAVDDIIGQDPLLGPLIEADNTLTHALLPSSPAIDAGNNTDAPLVDQRGFPRTFNTVDIGAYESPDLVNEAPVVAVPGSVFTLYDSSVSNTPDKQGFTYRGIALTPPILASQTFAAGGTVLNTRLDYEDYAGYLGQPSLMPTLDRDSGYTVTFAVQIVQENHPDTDKDGDGKDDRAGFNVVVLGKDNQGIALGFWQDKVWAYEGGAAEPPDGKLLTQAESVAFSTTSLTVYKLAVYGDTYSLSTNGSVILTGNLRDYTAFDGVLFNLYTMPNLVFLGDNTPSARAQIKLTDVSITAGTKPIANSGDDTVFNGITVNDVDVASHLLTTTLNVLSGTLSVAPFGTTVSTSTGQITITGNLTNTNRTLAAGVTYTPHITEGVDSLTALANDQGHTGAWPFVAYGDAQSSGAITVSGSIITMTNTGSGLSQLDDDGAGSGYLFTYQKVAGDFDVRVETVAQSNLEDGTPLNAQAHLGLEVRAGLDSTADKLFLVADQEDEIQCQLRHNGTLTDLCPPLSPAPQVDWVGAPRKGDAPLTVQFTSTVTGTATAYLWHFGDGRTAHTPNPTHTYQSAGNFGVTLIVTGTDQAARLSKSNYIIVNAAAGVPTATFSADMARGVAPHTVTFTAVPSGTVEHWWWDFGDGSTASAGPVVSHTYVTSGTFEVSLTVSNTHGSFTVNQPDAVVITHPAWLRIVRDGDVFKLFYAYAHEPTVWTLQATQEVVMQPNAAVFLGLVNTPDDATRKNMGVFDNYDLWSTNQVSITVQAPSRADFIAAPTLGFAPLSVVFTDTTVTSPPNDPTLTHLWDFGDGVTSTLANPTHIYTTAGSYTVTLTINTANGSDTLVRPAYITVYEPVHANFIAAPRQGVVSLTTQFTDTSTGPVAVWQWDFGDGTVSTLQHPTHTYTSTGVYTVSLTVQVNGQSAALPGGSDTLTRKHYITVTEPAPQVDFVGVPRSGDAPLTVQFTSTVTNTVTAYAWEFGDGGVASTANPTHTYESGGTFDVTLMVTGPGGTAQATQPDYITVIAPPGVPTATFSADVVSGTAPLTVTFTAVTSGTVEGWHWTFGDGGEAFEGPEVIHTYVTSDTFDVSLTVSNTHGSYMASESDYITVNTKTTEAPFAIYLPLVVRKN